MTLRWYCTIWCSSVDDFDTDIKSQKGTDWEKSHKTNNTPALMVTRVNFFNFQRHLYDIHWELRSTGLTLKKANTLLLITIFPVQIWNEIWEQYTSISRHLPKSVYHRRHLGKTPPEHIHDSEYLEELNETHPCISLFAVDVEVHACPVPQRQIRSQKLSRIAFTLVSRYPHKLARVVSLGLQVVQSDFIVFFLVIQNFQKKKNNNNYAKLSMYI